MIYRQIICPHCGNETTVKNISEGQKCKWCRRLILAKFTRKGKKWHCEAEAINFPVESPGFGKRSLEEWRNTDIYGHKKD